MKYTTTINFQEIFWNSLSVIYEIFSIIDGRHLGLSMNINSNRKSREAPSKDKPIHTDSFRSVDENHLHKV